MYELTAVRIELCIDSGLVNVVKSAFIKVGRESQADRSISSDLAIYLGDVHLTKAEFSASGVYQIAMYFSHGSLKICDDIP